MIKFQSFLSGSSGNCTYVTNDSAHILVDCGATGKYITQCMERIGAAPERLDAILVTHEHRDHIAGVGVLARKYRIPVYATEGTWQQMEHICGAVPADCRERCRSNGEFRIAGLTVRPFAIPHDAAEPVGYHFCDGDGAFSVATDIGHIGDELLEQLSGSTSVIIEANHDLDMLRTGRYPYPLKRRILGERGHLSNDTCGRLCSMLAQRGTKSFWLGHLSKENNVPALAYDTVKSILQEEGWAVGSDVGLNVLPRYWLK